MNKKLLLVFITVVAMASFISCKSGPVINTQQVTASRMSQELPREDPNSALWNNVQEHPAKLMVQDVTEPKLTEPGVELLRVRAMHNGNWVVFRLEWEDQSQNLIPETGFGSDAAAIQFPEQAGADVPDAAMGEKGKGVRIWFWKSVWQDDAERAQQGKGDRIASLYPQGSADHYPFNANPEAKAEMESRYAPARAAGNPITVRHGNSPIQVVMAEGFGNLTPAPSQEGAGRGVWKDGHWVTTIARPLNAGQGMGALEVGKKTYIAFAVWDGAARHTGSRKMRSGWIPLVLE
jgi:hypothetical protein